MKTILTILLITTLISCSNKKIHYTYQVEYINGENELLTIQKHCVLENGCIRHFKSVAIRCGVKKITLIKSELKDKI